MPCPNNMCLSSKNVQCFLLNFLKQVSLTQKLWISNQNPTQFMDITYLITSIHRLTQGPLYFSSGDTSDQDVLSLVLCKLIKILKRQQSSETVKIHHLRYFQAIYSNFYLSSWEESLPRLAALNYRTRATSCKILYIDAAHAPATPSPCSSGGAQPIQSRYLVFSLGFNTIFCI